MATIKEFKCLECDKTFKAGDWDCFPGRPHVVEHKTYYMDDAPFDKRSCKDSRTIIENLVPERTGVDGTGRSTPIPGRQIVFSRGVYGTDSPQEQFYLDNRKGLCTKERWEEVYFSDVEKFELQKQKLRADQERLEKDKNDLLAKVKGDVRARANA